MKKIVLVLLPIIGVFQSCSNKNKVTTSDLEKKQADSLLLRKYQQKMRVIVLTQTVIRRVIRAQHMRHTFQVIRHITIMGNIIMGTIK